MGTKNGFTIIELLMVVAIVGVLFSVGLPISYNLYKSYGASSTALDVMFYVSEIRREAFLYSEHKVMATQEEQLIVGGEKKDFQGVRFHISAPIVFYSNGTSSGGMISFNIGEYSYRLEVKSPMGDLSLIKA